MSRSPSRTPEKATERAEDRRMSVSPTRSRPAGSEEPAPPKRARLDTRKEDNARGKRLFGNLLGTLQRFQKDDKTSRTSEAAKRREQLSARIASKIQSESNLHHDIQETDRELKALRISTESAESVLKQKEAATSARHAALRPISRFLHTPLPPSATPIFDGKLLNPSPIPLNQGPTKGPHSTTVLKPLYFLPKVLLPEQEAELQLGITKIDELIADEAAALAKEKEETAETVQKNRQRIEELSVKLSDLRKQVKPLEIKGRASRDPDVDELGRQKRGESESMDVEEERPRETEREREAAVREAAVQIRGEDGDVEVEY